MEKTQVEAVCTVGILTKDTLMRSHMNRISPGSLHVVKKVKILEFWIYQDSSLFFLVYIFCIYCYGIFLFSFPR